MPPSVAPCYQCGRPFSLFVLRCKLCGTVFCDPGFGCDAGDLESQQCWDCYHERLADEQTEEEKEAVWKKATDVLNAVLVGAGIVRSLEPVVPKWVNFTEEEKAETVEAFKATIAVERHKLVDRAFIIIERKAQKLIDAAIEAKENEELH